MVPFRYSPGPMVFADAADEDLALDVRAGFLTFIPAIGCWPLDEWRNVCRNDILIWTIRTANFVAQNPEFVPLAREAALVVLPRDETPVTEGLADLRRLQWTNAADVYWQWRVAIGVPPDHIERPRH